jgi:hypothetical protein
MNTDHDLRERFAHQRRSDHEHAPAWNPRHHEAPVRRTAWHLPLWLPITATVCVLMSFVWLHDDAPTADLIAAMPEFFTTHGEPLFASLSPTTPSDSFLPIHLTIQLP